ncbi:hypothetical protein ORJ04_20080 [Rheinheimera baltica]|uniref:Uncharacterized protein n=1 Tax=Rheinheimera baltica TaxID=67576 RepID=A0ABT9I4C4_9GAMM|nr:hypothetical protein [Rheinheimera baltica]MDP5138251.1 hypothetical protein [Rheinheimera baltica]MDP5148612.1 hypothetical protein [Rheinheimera baltica]
MVFSELYRKKLQNLSFQIWVKYVNSAFSEVSGEDGLSDIVYLFLLIDCDTDTAIFEKIRKGLGLLSEHQKKYIFDELAAYVSELDIEAFLNCVVSQDFVWAVGLFRNFLYSEKVSVIDKFILYGELVSELDNAECFYIFTNNIIDIAASVFSNDLSVKGEVRFAVRILKMIIRDVGKYKDESQEVLDALYVQNEVWKMYYEEEISHRKKVLTESFNLKVNNAIKIGDYEKVIKLIGPYESEISGLLKKKLMFCRKRLANK